MTDQDYMLRAITLAQKGKGWTNPNPMVGAVIVKNGEIIGEGYHHKCGDLHAERDAFSNLKEKAEGATMYVTLEPCCHQGKQPPCTEAIVEHKIKRVVIGSRDPNPLVSGKGVRYLRELGIEVVEDFMREECDQMNPIFFHYITTKRPYITLKYAMTADGKIATKTGDSKWITGEASRKVVHELRHNHMAILAGIGTVMADDPMLNSRLEGKKNPIRIICDSKLRIPLDSRIVKTAKEQETIVAYAFSDEEKEKALTEAGVKLLYVPEENVSGAMVKNETLGKVDISALVKKLGTMGIDSILVEGGGTINDSFREDELVNQVEIFIGPQIFGGNQAKTPVMGQGVSMVKEALLLELKNLEILGSDIHLTYRKKA